MLDLRNRFPGVSEGSYQGWARFDGPAGTQVVDAAVEATGSWQRSGHNANSHGAFAASEACDALVEGVQHTMGRLLNTDPAGFMFGPSTTANVFSITRAIGRDLSPGDEIVCTRLDHDSNVAPWLEMAGDVGAIVRMAPFEVETGRLPVESITDLLYERTRWVAVTGASNAIGTRPDVAAISAAAHAAGAKVLVDGVHLTPHAWVDVSALGADAYVTSAYKWYGPHGSALWLTDEVRDDLVPYKVRPAPDEGPERWQLGTPAYENLAGIEATARFLVAEGMHAVVARERVVFGRLLDGLLAMPHVSVWGPHDLADRAPTLAFTVAGHHPDDVARSLAAEQVAVWSGHYYAVEVMASLGLDATGGAVRAGISCYTTDDDVDRLVAAVARLA
jgi:cysteine desulfurase family protein (TIGR01976 family)